MTSFKRLVLLSIVLALVFGFAVKAHAAWDGLFCDIYNGSASALTEAVNLYNNDPEDERACKVAVRFFSPQTVSIPDGLTIFQVPPQGQEYGFGLRKCIATGVFSEEGCPEMDNTDVIIDASGYEADEGDCPIRVANGAKVSFVNLKLIVKNKDKAICTLGSGTPIPSEDSSNTYAWIHNVTIVEPDHFVSRGFMDIRSFFSGGAPVKNRRF